MRSSKLQSNILKIMIVDPKSDARYHKTDGSKNVFLNLARYDIDKDPFFCLFAIARELSYMKTGRINYQFITFLRDILTTGLSKTSSSAF